MEPKQWAPQHLGMSDAPHVLLAGFPSDEADSIIAALNQMGWFSTALEKEAEIEAAFSATRFDLTVIDAEHLEVFAPVFIARLRDKQGPSSDTAILAVDNSPFAGFKDQLIEAGADLIARKPADAEMYLFKFARAVTTRLQSVGVRLVRRHSW